MMAVANPDRTTWEKSGQFSPENFQRTQRITDSLEEMAALTKSITETLEQFKELDMEEE